MDSIRNQFGPTIPRSSSSCHSIGAKAAAASNAAKDRAIAIHRFRTAEGPGGIAESRSFRIALALWYLRCGSRWRHLAIMAATQGGTSRLNVRGSLGV